MLLKTSFFIASPVPQCRIWIWMSNVGAENAEIEMLHEFQNKTNFKISFFEKINHTLFWVLVTLKKFLFPVISFLRIICKVITFGNIHTFFLPFNS